MAQYKMVAEWNLPNGSVAQNVFYAAVIDGETADQDDLITDLTDEITRILTPWLATVATNVILALVRIYLLDVATGATTPVGVGAINQAGTGAFHALPGGVAVKINAYLEGRARPFGVYLAGLDEGGLEADGSLTAVAQAAALATAAANTVVTIMSLTGLAYRPRYYSLKDFTLIQADGSNYEVDDTADYQRRRKAGRGI